MEGTIVSICFLFQLNIALNVFKVNNWWGIIHLVRTQVFQNFHVNVRVMG